MNDHTTLQPAVIKDRPATEEEPRPDLPNVEPPPVAMAAVAEARTSHAQVALMVLGTIAFLYFARPVILPVILACVAGMTLKPLVRWLSYCHFRPPFAAAIVLSLLLTFVVVVFLQLGRPGMAYVNDAPEHMTQLRQQVQKLFTGAPRISQAAAAVNNLGATEEEKKEEQKQTPTVQVKDTRGTSSALNWTGTFLAGTGETLILLYLLLASGDLFLQKLVHVMPTMSDKKRAVEISHEIQQNISNYLFSVCLINAGLGTLVSLGLYWLGVPNAALWGILAAILNFVPYFGPVVGVLLLCGVGLLSFDTVWQGILPAVWYLLLHTLEANLITPVLLGRRFTLNPVVIFVSLIFWTWLWGVPGALLSVPILVSIKVICDRVPTLSSISELLTK